MLFIAMLAKAVQGPSLVAISYSVDLLQMPKRPLLTMDRKDSAMVKVSRSLPKLDMLNTLSRFICEK